MRGREREIEGDRGREGERVGDRGRDIQSEIYTEIQSESIVRNNEIYRDLKGDIYGLQKDIYRERGIQ